MNKSRANLAVVAARASSAGRTAPINLPTHLTPPTRKGAIGPIRRARSYSGAAAMRSGDGSGQSLWAAPAELRYSDSVIANDSKWKATVSG